MSAKEGKLLVELVPRTTWGWNLRSELTRTEWDRIRKAVYERAGHLCEVCGGRGKKHPVEAHERWEYDDRTRVQKLVGLEALCPPCHEVRHLGRAISTGRGKLAFEHLSRMNGWTSDETRLHVEEAFLRWRERSTHDWTLDVTWLRNAQV